MRTEQIAEMINRQRLHIRKDGQPVTSNEGVSKYNLPTNLSSRALRRICKLQLYAYRFFGQSPLQLVFTSFRMIRHCDRHFSFWHTLILIDIFVKCEIAKVTKLRVAGCVLFNLLIINMSCYMHDVTPKVVAIAVRIVMAMWMIFFQISCLFMFS